MIESTNLFTETSARPSYDINEDIEENNSVNQEQDENLNLMTQDFEEKQLTAPPQEQTIQSIELQTENELIVNVQNLSRKLNISTIVAYWEIGRMINSYYKGKYGSNDLQRIADGAEVGKDTLAKACKFARIYTGEQLKILIEGNFHLSWSQIAQNLTVEPQKLIDVYQAVDTPAEFYNGIIKLKNPCETRGKAVKKVKAGENVRIAAAVEAPVLPDRNEVPLVESDNFHDKAEEPPFNDQVIDVMDKPLDQKVDQVYESYRMELESVKAENEELKAKIEELREVYNELNEEIKECDRIRMRLRDIGQNYQSFLQWILRKTKEGIASEEICQQLQRVEIDPYMTGEIFNL